MKICTKCNEKFENGKFCKYCGGALVEENAGTQEAHCTNCGALLKDGAKFCPQCGTKTGSGKVSIRDFDKINFDHLEQYDLATLAWARLECPKTQNGIFDDFIMQNYGMEGLLSEDAKTHDANVQCYIGVCYVSGSGCEEDKYKAFEWYQKSAEQGNAGAQCCLGMCYFMGAGCEEDEGKAFEWYTKSAEQGNANAQFELGECYSSGTGCEKDKRKAFEWNTKAAEQGNNRATYELNKNKWNRFREG